jgi:hypothetical protein
MTIYVSSLSIHRRDIESFPGCFDGNRVGDEAEKPVGDKAEKRVSDKAEKHAQDEAEKRDGDEVE